MRRLTYCGVNAHFQNGIAEKRIRDLQEQARIMLLHAINQWPNMLSIHLWPYAFRHANEVFNTLPYHQDGASPLERFNNVAIVAGHVDEPSNNARESRSGLSDNDPGSAVPIRVELDQQ